jgi:hypothetical protein
MKHQSTASLVVQMTATPSDVRGQYRLHALAERTRPPGLMDKPLSRVPGSQRSYRQGNDYHQRGVRADELDRSICFLSRDWFMGQQCHRGSRFLLLHDCPECHPDCCRYRHTGRSPERDT